MNSLNQVTKSILLACGIGALLVILSLVRAMGADGALANVSGTTQIGGNITASNVIDSSNVKYWGAVGDGVTDDTAALQRAIDYNQINGNNLYIPWGRYMVSSSLLVTNGLRIIGGGFPLTLLQLVAGTPTSVSLLKWTPSPASTVDRYSSISGITFINSAGEGKDLLELNTSGAFQLQRMTISDCYFTKPSGWSIRQTATAVDQYFLNRFENCVFLGGVLMTNCGDNVSFRYCQFADVNTPAIDFHGVPSAAGFLMDKCNITSSGGASPIRIRQASEFVINMCNIQALLTNTSSYISVEGSSGQHVQGFAMYDTIMNATLYTNAVSLNYVDSPVFYRIGFEGSGPHISTTANTTGFSELQMGIASSIAGTVLRLNDNQFVITNGNVGIGVATPVPIIGKTISVSNSAGSTIQLKGSTVSGILTANEPQGQFALVGSTSHPLVLGTLDAERMRITSGGDVGIGVTPTAIYGRTLQIEGAGGSTIYMTAGTGEVGLLAPHAGVFEIAASQPMKFMISDVEKMRLTSAGVGIGTLTVTNNVTLNTTNAAPAGFVVGTTVPAVWFAVTNDGNRYLIPGYTP